MTEEPASAPPRRHGRFRRWIVRPAIWALAAVALAIAGLSYLFHSEWLLQQERAFLEARLSELFGRTVTARSVDIHLLPLEIEARDLVIAGRRPQDPPWASVRRLSVYADPEGLRSSTLRLRAVVLERPRIHLEWDESGEDNIPRFRSAAGKRKVSILIDALSVRDGILELDHREVPMTLEAHAVSALLLDAGGKRLGGRVAVQDVEVVLPDAQPVRCAVAARVVLDSEGLTIANARVTAPDFDARVTGRVGWHGATTVHLEGTVDTAAAFFQRLGYIDREIEGAARFAGKLDWSRERWVVDGQVAAPRLELYGFGLAGAAGDLTIDRERAHFALAHAVYDEGEASGELTVALAGAERRFDLAIDLDGVDLRRLLAERDIPIGEADARLRGHVTFSFLPKAAARGEGRADLEIVAADGAGVPVEGIARLAIGGGEVRSETITLSTPSEQVTAQGAYEIASGRGAFDFRATSEDLDSLARLLPIAREPPVVWLPRRGLGELSGRLEIAPAGQTAVRLNLNLAEVAAPGLAADRVVGSLHLGANLLDELALHATRPGRAVTITGRVPFGDTGQPAPPGLQLTVEPSAWPLAEAAPWLPFELPFTGDLSGRLQLAGSLDHPVGELTGSLASATAFGVPFARLDTHLAWDSEVLTVSRVVGRLAPFAGAEEGAGEISGAGRLRLADGGLDFQLTAHDVELRRMPYHDLLPGVDGGHLELAATVRGTLDRPAIEATATAREVTVAGRPLGAAAESPATFAWDGEHLEARGSLLGLLSVAGGGTLDGEHAALDLQVESANLGTLAAAVLVAPPADLAGHVAGRLRIDGRFTGTPPLTARLDLPTVALRWQRHDIVATEPVAIVATREAVELRSVYLAEEASASELFVAGRIGLVPEARLDLRLQGSAAASWLEELVPALDANGTIDVLGRVSGTFAAPAFDGQAELRDGRLILRDFPHSLERLRAVVLFDPDQIVLDSLTGVLGGGDVTAGGALQLPRPNAPLSYRFQAELRRVTLRYPAGWLMRGDANLALLSQGEGRQVRGSIDLDRVYYLQDMPINVGDLLVRFLQRQRLEAGSADESMAATALNLIVRAPGAVRVRNNLADLRGGADLSVRGTLAQPVLFGRVEVEPGGKVTYGENDYVVERGRLTFANPSRIEPIIDLVAKTKVDEYNVTLTLSGPLERLEATFASDPPLADLDVLSLLTTGQAPTETSTTAPAGVATDTAQNTTAQGVLYGQAASLISERVNRLFGLDKFKIEPLTTGDTLASARLTVGKRLSKRLYVTYSVDPSTTEQQKVQVEWKLGEQLVLVFTQNGNGSYSADARWERTH